jgi:secreted trypsin-like serine protease
MKLFVLLASLAVASCEIDLKTFDWSSVKPLHEIDEWRQVHKNHAEFHVANPRLSSRIINGDIAGSRQFPYMAGVLLHFDTGNSFCGGSLISRKFVLTAANCVHLVPSASILLGASNMFGNIEINVRVERIRVHPEYSVDESLNDIATLEMRQEVTLSETVNLVRLPNRRQVQTTFENQQGLVAGWGRTSGSGTQPIPTQFLRTLGSSIITNTSCRLRFPAYITASNICTDASTGTPCSGDQGGPLMIVEADGRRTQVGIFSYQFSLG